MIDKKDRDITKNKKKKSKNYGMDRLYYNLKNK